MLNRNLLKPVLKYPGAKWVQAPRIRSFFPVHRTYIEPYFGSGAVFFSKHPSEYEVINDTSRSIYNLFTVVRERGEELAKAIALTPWSRDEYYASYTLTGEPLEDARRFLVRCWQAHGTRLNQRTGWRNRGSADGGHTTQLWCQLPERLLAVIERLKQAEIENKPAVEVIARFVDDPMCVIYADPPYVLSTRQGRKLYEEEMTNDEHSALLDLLDGCKGFVILSGYTHPLYERRLSHWYRVTLPSVVEKGQHRTEVLWMNPRAASCQQLSLFEEEERR